MKRQLTELSVVIIFFILLLSFSTKTYAQYSNGKAKVEDGIYLIERSGNDKTALMPLKHNEHIITFNQEFIDKTDPGVKYLVINSNEFVSLKLSAKPVEEEQPDKRKKLLLSLTEDAKKELAKFTEKNLNKLTSIVVGGQALTMHKIKAVITSGLLQITRCTDNACEMLFVELSDNVAGK